MKNSITKLLAVSFLVLGTLPTANADEPENVEAGPRKGRLLATDSPRPEFFVEKDHTVSVKFYDKDGEVVEPTEQQITVIATGSAKAKLQLEKEGDSLISKEKLPEGDGYNLVVQVRSTAEARPKNFRFTFLNHICLGACGNPEYACTCDEGEEEEAAEREKKK